jgi:hypothetical protein
VLFAGFSTHSHQRSNASFAIVLDPEQKIDHNPEHERQADGDGGIPNNLAPIPIHKSSRLPLKRGWRALPSADFARYSISVSREGTIQTLR